MKNLLSVFFLVLSVTTFGQSKKVINQQLKLELEQKVKVYDSIQRLHVEMSNGITELRSEIQDKKQLVERLQREDYSKRTILSRNHRLLKEQGGNADGIITEKEIVALKSPSVDVKYLVKPELLNPKFQLMYIEKMDDLTGVKLKLQNELLRQKIAEYNKINGHNQEVLLNETSVIAKMMEAKLEYISVSETYPAFNKQLEEKADALAIAWYELRKKRDEQNRLAAEKEIMEARKKGKTVPPLVFEHATREYEDEPHLSSTLSLKMRPKYGSSYGNDPSPEPEPVYQMETEAPQIYELVEEPAEFPGGPEELMKYLKENITIPAVVAELGIKGRTYLRFIVSSKGVISNVKVMRGVPDCKECDDEAVRVVKTMPKWMPGKNNGKPVDMWYNLPVKFEP